ncbi:accessory Sec system S-layer assembly protein [Heyndrickxia oleronia]|jgi:accessory Sec system S-layer assembly protein|uniref:accessory Sec system S-layer assembly protein n=1 Tax=Heyndrickxia oleronia TaxID=38875 RepID=UPI00203CA63F|nr:accessory Sec system S-layer assembly protein [Heyndrickxia oleronia]MCI1589874.1 accessory Sec system S-layer assembly protein [Heyndrickxia oleronia]MCI1611585.1 accessory Sec system S-layer assembly protein [Heyndrickxia oleronia]MCI1743500.1 accessory Sec system S-layer assembly protein [Heyndrickxia oleronia]MCI1760107.1 accessory Sec system S-layer assembly protein [Heyndrickxia oleronia]MCM3238462.1 accessory Sec system S-layer assembly protein [Heyndrickxia oleronia]
MFFIGKNKKRGRDSVVSSSDLLNEEVTDQANMEEEIETELSILPGSNISQEREYVLRFLNNECAPLKPNQVSLSGVEINIDSAENLIVTAFVRSSLNKAITFQSVPLILLGSEGEVLGKKTFDLGEIGELPPKSSRPWDFVFTKKDLFTDSVPKDGWKLAFEIKKPHSLDLAKSWEQSLAEEDKEKLKQLLNTVQPPKPGEVNFMGIQANINEEGNLHITLLIRNGSDKNIQIQQLPLTVEDATGEIIAQGGFKLEDFEVKANTSKPWTFIFPKSLVTKEQPDLSTWKVQPPK